MNVEIISSKLQGTIDAVTSKSYTHRALIILSLLNNCGKIINPSICEDTITTMKYLNAMGVKTIIENNVITVSKQSELINPSFFPYNDNSCTSIRLLLPIVTELFTEANFLISEKLFERLTNTNLESYFDYQFSSLENNKIMLNVQKKAQLPYLSLEKTSQYASGFLLLSVLKNSKFNFDSITLPSYLLMTIDYLEKVGISFNIIKAENTSQVNTYNYNLINYYNFNVEGDYSLMANFIILGCYYSKIIINNLSDNSIQGDYKILEILNNLFETKPFYFSNNQLLFNKTVLKGNASLNIDISNIPDIAPLLMAYALLLNEPSKFYNFEKLNYKESNRIISTLATIKNMNGRYKLTDKVIEIYPSNLSFDKPFDSYNDHRIVFLIAIIALIENRTCTINNCQCFKKSYPEFFDNLLKLSSKCIFKED